MATGTNHYKLGLFVLLGLTLSLAVVVTLGARNWNEESVHYVTYFDESVQGLELGSPVKFRGVSVGRVSGIGIAPDQRHVQVTSELTVTDLQRLNLGGGGEAPLAELAAVSVALRDSDAVAFTRAEHGDVEPAHVHEPASALGQAPLLALPGEAAGVEARASSAK